MARAKKDGRHINYYIDRKIYEKVEEFAEEKKYTVTAAIEILLEKGLNANVNLQEQSDKS